MNNIKSKYKSYFGDDNNNVYYEIRGDSKNNKNNTQKIVMKRILQKNIVHLKNMFIK